MLVSVVGVVAIFAITGTGIVQILGKKLNSEFVLLVTGMALTAVVAIGIPLVHPEASVSPVIAEMAIGCFLVTLFGFGTRLVGKRRKKD